MRKIRGESPDGKLRATRCDKVLKRDEVIDLVQGNSLGVEVKNGVLHSDWLSIPRMSSSLHDDLLSRYVNGLHIGAGSPGAIYRANGVSVPTETPGLVWRVVSDKCKAGAKSVLRRDVADCDVQRMVSKENLSTVEDRFEARTATREAGTFLVEISTEPGFVLSP